MADRGLGFFLLQSIFLNSFPNSSLASQSTRVHSHEQTILCCAQIWPMRDRGFWGMQFSRILTASTSASTSVPSYEHSILSYSQIWPMGNRGFGVGLDGNLFLRFWLLPHPQPRSSLASQSSRVPSHEQTVVGSVNVKRGFRPGSVGTRFIRFLPLPHPPVSRNAVLTFHY
jgi:hypothetical protein